MASKATQQEVYEYFMEHALDAATVGDYVHVTVREMGSGQKSCFGPDVQDGGSRLGWQVVMIDWANRQFTLAPDGGGEDGD